jgi:hypothetical protein
MRRFLVFGGVAVLALVALWSFTARWCSLLVEQVYTPRLATLQSTPLGWNGIWLQFGPAIPGLLGPEGWSGPELLLGGHIVDLRGPDDQPVARIEVDAQDQLVLSKDGQSFVFGSRAGTITGDDKEIPAFAAGPGDRASVTIERSLLYWPAPFALNFIWGAGAAASWQRSFYYRLSWRKPSGAQLTIVWRLRQGYESINGWHPPGPLESIRIEIRPASPAGGGF